MSATQKTKVRSYSEFVQDLNKVASAKKEAKQQGDTPPEKDPADKGTVTVPVDKDGKPEKYLAPASSTNTDTTPVLSPPSPSKTISEPEKTAGTLLGKATKLANALKDLKVSSKMAGMEVKKPQVAALLPNPHDNKGGTQAPAPVSSGPKGDPISKGAESTEPNVEDKTNKGTIEAPKGDSKGQMPPDPKNTTTSPGGEKMAANDEIAFDPQFHFKLASLVLQSEEGRLVAQQLLEREHGLQAADDIIKAAAYMEEIAMATAEAEATGAAWAEDMWKQASEEERNGIIKLANSLQAARDTYPTELEKEAFDAGAASAAQMGDAGMMGEQAPPEAGSENISDEDIISVLDELVQSGQITPEIAAQILQALQGGGAGGEAGGAPGADPAAAAAAAGGAAPGGMPPGMPPEMPPGAAAAPGGMPPEMPPAKPAAEAPPEKKKESPPEKKKEEKDKEAALNPVLASALLADKLLEEAA